MENSLYDITLFSHLPAFTALVFALLLLFKKEKHGVSAKIMGVTLLVWTVISGSYLIDPGTDYAMMYKGDILYNSLVLLVIPLHAVYFSFLTQNRLRLRTAVWLFVPPLIATLVFIVAYALAGEENAFVFIRNYLAGAGLPLPDDWRYRVLTTTYAFINPLIILESVAAMTYIYRLLKQYDRRLEDYYSNMDDKNKPDNYFVFYATLVLLAVCTIYTLIVEIDSTTERAMLETGLITVAVLFFLIGQSVLSNHFSAADMDYELARTGREELPEETGASESPAKGAAQNNLESLDKRLQEVLASEKLHLQADLTLDALATRLYTNRTYLSQLFNQVYGVHFYEYINILRVKHAEELLSDPDSGLSLDEIYMASGFSAKSSFYRIFKQANDCTPTAWRKNLQDRTNF